MLPLPRRATGPLAALLLALSLLAPAGAAAHRAAHRSHPAARALRLAAASARRADARLVRQARKLDRCLIASAGHAGACGRLHRSLQRAGTRASAAQWALSRLARRAGHPRRARSSSYWATPSLKASGDRLSWGSVAHAGEYVVVAQIPGQASRYSVVGATSFTPPPVPGATVTYKVRTAWRWSPWSNAVQISYPAPPPPPTPTPPSGPPSEELNTKAAPAVTVSGQTLSWNVVAKVSAYVLATKVPGQAETFTAVNGTSVTPPAVPGKTVRYSVRTAVEGSAWAPEVSIAYPAPPAETPAPKQPEPPAAEGFQPGIDSGWQSQDLSGTAILGAKVVRIEWEIGAPVSQLEPVIAAYAAKGVRVAPLAGFAGRLPSPAEARNLASWAKAFGPGGTFWAGRSDGSLAIRTIEFGNETSYGYQYHDNAGEPSYQSRAENYALRLKEAAESISAAGEKVGLLAVNDDWTGDWMNGMFTAVPNLGSYVAGWTVHPYGTGGMTKVKNALAQAAAHGAPASIPIDITEWGLSTDGSSCVAENYGFNPCMSYQEAADQLRKSLGEFKSLLGSRLGLFIIYQVRDQSMPGVTTNREAYFGLLQHEDASKGPYTQAAQEVLAQ